jgi:predicted GTPase
LYGASEDPLHELVVEQGQRAIATPICSCCSSMDARALSGDERSRASCARPACRAARDQQDRRQALAASSMEFFQLGFDPVLEISAEHGTGVASCWMRS